MMTDQLPNTFRYLDLSTAFIPEREREGLAAEGARDGRGRNWTDLPRVINHYYGWWVNVPEAEEGRDDERFTDFPALRACIEAARKRGCNWINFDADASDDDPELQVYEDFDASSVEADPMQAQRRGQ